MGFKVKDVKIRHFGGQLSVHVDYKGTPEEIRTGKDKRNFEKKHLKAYLRGDKEFSWGKDIQNNPIWYKVNEIWS
jgi:hypothetical protein